MIIEIIIGLLIILIIMVLTYCVGKIVNNFSNDNESNFLMGVMTLLLIFGCLFISYALGSYVLRLI